MPAKTIVQYILKVKTDKTERNLKDTARAADRTGDAFKRTKTSGLQMASQIGAATTGMVAGVAAAAAGVRILKDAFVFAARESFEFSKAVVDSVNQLNDLTARSGLAADSIQAIILAFEGSGQSAKAAESFVSRFPRLFADLAAGSGRASEAAAQLGISIKDANGEMRSADEILRDTTRALQGIKDDTTRATAGFLLFGRGAGEFLQAFGKTADFENFMALAEQFGVKTGPEASRQAAIWQEQMATLSIVWSGLRQAIDESLGATKRFNQGMRKMIGWLAGAQALIEEQGDSFDRLGKSMTSLVSSMLPTMQLVLGGMVKLMGNFIGNLALATDMIIDLMLSFRKFLDLGARRLPQFMLADQMIPSRSNLEAISKEMDGIVLSSLQVASAFNEIGGMVQGKGDTDAVFSRGQSDILARVDAIIAGLTGAAEDAGFSLDEMADETGEAADEMRKLTVKTSQTLRNMDMMLTGGVPEIMRGATGLAGEAAGKLSPLLATSAVPAIAASGASGVAASIAGALANPAVGAAIAGVAILAKLGEKTPEERRVELMGQVQSIRDGLSFLPEILLQVLPQVALALVEALLDGIVLALINLGNMVIEGFRSIFTREGRQQRREDLQSIGEFWKNFLDPNKTASFAGGGRFLPQAQGGIRFTGQTQGLAMLHQGEYVVPQSGQAPQGVARQMGGMGGSQVNVSIHSPVVDQNAVDALVRRIEERFNSNYGLASSSLFGGR